jgi:hypothetical protein
MNMMKMRGSVLPVAKALSLRDQTRRFDC